MNKYLYIILTGALALSCMKQPEQEAPIAPEKEAVSTVSKGKVVVLFSDEMVSLIEAGQSDIATKAPGLGSLMDDLGVESMERVFPHAGQFEERTRREGLHRYYKVTYKADVPVTKAMDGFCSIPGVILSEPVRPVRKRAFFNDPYFSRQWHYVNGRYPSADIHVQEVWERYTLGSNKVIVCVVDEPVDPTHPDLQANLWKDSEGHTGYNFVRDNYDLSIRPDNGDGDLGHGTHVAGTISAVNNNGIGLCGLAGGDYASGMQGVLIQSAAIWSGKYSADDDGTCNAIKWGADHGALISQNSWGYYADDDGNGEVSSSELAAFKNLNIDSATKAAIDYFIKYAGCDNSGNQLPDSPMKGGLVIFAAGNENIDYDPICNYDPVIAVGAYDVDGNRASYSNYGKWVDIGAPGGEGTGSDNSIWSTLPKTIAGDYGNTTTNWYGGTGWAGTSMACPHASGVAALLVSYFGGPGFTADMCKKFLIEGATDNFFTSTRPIGRKLDALGSIEYGINHNAGGPGVSVSIKVTPAIPSQIHAHETVNANITATCTANEAVTILLMNAPTGVSISEGVLSISGPSSATGAHSFTIKATSTSGASATYNVAYTILQNHAPAADGTVSDRLFPSMSPSTVSISDIFSDPDGEIPSVSAVSSNPEVLKAEVSGGTLYLTPIGYGDAVVTLTASDFFGLNASLSFKNVVYDASTPAQAYPQQVKDNLNVRITSKDTRKTRIRISTTSGAIVYDKESFMDVYTPAHVDMSKCAPGIYTVAVTYSGKTSTSRVVKL